jgi:hypothetical protein
MNLIFTKTLRDGRSAEIFFDGRSLYSSKINGVAAGSGHGITFRGPGIYSVGAVGLTAVEKNVAEAAADAIRLAPDYSQIRINGVSDARRSGEINKFAAGGVL